MYAGKSYTKAKAQAQANADRTGTRRYIFLDTSGNLRVETTRPPQELWEVIIPRKEKA